MDNDPIPSFDPCLGLSGGFNIQRHVPGQDVEINSQPGTLPMGSGLGVGD